ncbi:phosphatase PAP2 family protein [Fodinisporobacter ferrooxydans]|uniref:Phosphatase PAP2 family protein n=1 Tax=Fodinisporobacter ferrooxydans TaxID=2901836 RepID=A0ABY4CN16_9BACL|nr:phosphatase PAP2 family protein [Alicyclobacillaceae bacterium MYW30-H2]
MFNFITDPFFHTSLLLVMIAFALVDIKRDQKPINWLFFLPFGFLAFSFLYQAYQQRAAYEWQIMHTFFQKYYHYWNWDKAFTKIPLNNGWPFRLFRPHWLNVYFAFVYETAFYLNLWVGVIRGFFAKDIKKMFRYMFAGLVLQMIIIYPFYYTVLLQEVWFVQGDPDLLHRQFSSHAALLSTVADCFPSMHTSTAFAVLLLALRERGKWFKWLMVADCASIIVSTLYNKIHWLLDVLAGMLLAYITVIAVDWILDRLLPNVWRKIVVRIPLLSSIK